jgi:hypothetical protein
MPENGKRLSAVRRFDLLDHRLDGGAVQPNGWLKVDRAFISRTGVQEYRDAAGNVRRELRLPEEVFDEASLRSFAMMPMTDDHPKCGLLDAETCQEHQRGHLGETVQREGERVAAPILITDGGLIKKVLDGKRQLSCGYTCDLEDAPGTWNGQPYDLIQRNIRGNHVAVVDRARGGPELSLRLDSSDAASIGGNREHDEPLAPSREDTMAVKIKIDGIEVEVANEQAAQIIEKALQIRSDSVATLERTHKEVHAQLVQAQGDLTKETGRADALDAKAKGLEKDRADAADPKRLADAVRARIGLENQARRILGEDAKLDAMSEIDVMKAVLAKSRPKLKLDGKDAGYIEAAYGVTVADEEDRQGREGVRKARAASGTPEDRRDGEEDPPDASKLEKKFKADSEQAWKKLTVGVTAAS